MKLDRRAHYAAELRKLADTIEREGVTGIAVAAHLPGNLPGQSTTVTIAHAMNRLDGLTLMGDIELLKLELATEISIERAAETISDHQAIESWGRDGIN